MKTAKIKIRDCWDIRVEEDWVSKNHPCISCGFPNFDYQVSKKTNLCRKCEKEYLLNQLTKEIT